jgi:hypothetical protein
VSFGESGLIRGVSFGGSGLIRGVSFGESGLIRGVGVPHLLSGQISDALR